MAKPNAQTGHGPSSGAADESALPHGETSRRGADADADGPPGADWKVADAHDESSISRILGLVLVLVLVGVFSFVAYRKYNEAKLHPETVTADGISIHHGSDKPDSAAPGGANAADSRIADRGDAEHGAAAFNAGENEPAREPGATGRNLTAANGTAQNNTAPNGAAGTASAFSQLDEPSNPNAAFHPTNSGSAAEQPIQKPNAGLPTKTARQSPREAEVNPFGDVATNTPANTPGEKAAHGELQATPSTTAKPVGARNEQTEPLFNEGAAEKQANGKPPVQGEPVADQGRVSASGQTTPNSNMPNEAGWNDASKSQNAGSELRPAHAQLSSVQTAQNLPAQQTMPKQNEPATSDLLTEKSPAAEIGKSEPQPIARSAAPARPNVAPGSLLDQEEPAATTAQRDPVANGSTSAAGNAFSPSAAPQTAHAASTTAVHISSSKPAATDNEDLFAGKTAAASPNPGVAPVSQRQLPGSAGLAGSVRADTTLNEAGDSYVVQPQDTFWTISRKKYGTARYFRALAELNKAHVPDPTRMRPGVKVSTPPTEILETQYAQFLPKGSAIEVASGERAAGKSGPPGFFTSADGKAMYRTGEKDTLSDIAAKHLGRASRWIQVYEMNRDKLSNPNQLKVGTELVLPADASNVALTNDDAVRR